MRRYDSTSETQYLARHASDRLCAVRLCRGIASCPQRLFAMPAPVQWLARVPGWAHRHLARRISPDALLIRDGTCAVRGHHEHGWLCLGRDEREDRLAGIGPCPFLRGLVAERADGIEIVAHLPGCDRGRDEAGDAIFAVMELGAVHIALAGRRVDDEQRRVEPGGGAAHFFLQPLGNVSAADENARSLSPCRTNKRNRGEC